ncbi:MAG TPA: asparagine synthase (glutamine-hydrolyzing) [Aggregatilineaceae bacterium]|nr:asparagine synthase (glutamine-hydrolyzing) [Aggregatilineaceae bacterium]
MSIGTAGAQWIKAEARMCGICGVFAYQRPAPVSRALVREMADTLAHRGPDGAGEFYDDPSGLGLGHRRLAIIDLVSGDQPMTGDDGAVCIVFNGEIYNYRKLRAALEAAGHRFRTSSDTEVVLRAYQEYGPQCPARFNGIFAFAIWDARLRRLFLARDHFGVKPLYYSVQQGVFRFASEQKAILLDPSIPREIDLDALHLTLTFRYCPAPHTLFKAIRKLPPASYLLVDERGVREGRYWDDLPDIDRAAQAGQAAEALRDAYDRAVRWQMVSDVPIGLSLSGGVDSAVLLALMSRHSSEPVAAFTVGFAGREDVSEIDAARALAGHFGATFTAQVIAEADYADFMRRYLWHMEEPVVNQSAPAYYFVARMAREQGIKVLLNGQGPDEAFAGYPRHLAAAYLPRMRQLGLGWAGRVFFLAGRELPLPESYRRLIYALGARDEADLLLRIYSMLTESARRALFAPGVWRSLDRDLPLEWVRSRLARTPEGTLLEKMTFIDARSGLPEELLLSEDKMAMAAGVEARVPYLDLEVMRLAEALPGRLKIEGRQQKAIHKRACCALVPLAVVHRRKIGFVSAADRWLRGELGRHFAERVRAPDSLTRAYLNPDVVERLARQHLSGRWDHQRVLFLLLALETWHAVYVTRSEAISS